MLEARNVSLTCGAVPVIRHVSCCFSSSQITVLTGPNGSGKSMFLEILSALRNADEGGVFLDGLVYPQRGQPLGTGVGLVFQQPEMQIIEQTVEEDILFGLRNIGIEEEERQNRLEDALEWSGLGTRRRQYPQTLSGGELRCLALAGVIAMKPRFILLDEPFENLDYPGVRRVLRQILMLRDMGMGIVLVAHDLSKCLAHADRLIILKDGSIVADDEPEKLLRCLEDYDVRRPAMNIRDMTWR